MKPNEIFSNPTIWRQQPKFSANISSHGELVEFNAKGGVAVFIDVMQSEIPAITMSGSLSHTLSFWESRSKSGFVTKPKLSANLLTLRFVTYGHLIYHLDKSKLQLNAEVASLTAFDTLREVCAQSEVSTLSVTICEDALIAANKALNGEDFENLPDMAPIAPMSLPGIRSLFLVVRILKRRLLICGGDDDLTLPLIQEVMSYQLLSAWPRQETAPKRFSAEISSRPLKIAIDYIEENLSRNLTLAETAAAVGVSIRSLQIKFKRERGQTPIQYIISRRLSCAHEVLKIFSEDSPPIAEVARSWGFVHMSDFAQRYRERYGCTPSETRREARRQSTPIRRY